MIAMIVAVRSRNCSGCTQAEISWLYAFIKIVVVGDQNDSGGS